MLKRRRQFDQWTVITLGIILVYIVFMIYPVLSLLLASLRDAETGALSLKHFQKFFSKAYYMKAVVNSFKVSVSVTLCAVIVATPLAYIISTVKIKGSSWIRVFILISSMSAPFIGSYSWILLLGRNGYITRFFEHYLGITTPTIYGLPGIVLVLTLALVPLVFSYVCGALKNTDKSLLEAARNLGSGNFKIIMTIVVPLIIPTILAAGILVFMKALSDFGTPSLIGEGFKTVPQLIYNEFLGDVAADNGFAAAISVMVVAFALLAFVIQRAISNHLAFSMSAMYPIEPLPAYGIKNVLCHVYVYLYMLIALLPQICIWVTAFRKTKGLTFDEGYSLQSMKTAVSQMSVSIRNTLVFALSAAALIVFIAVLVSYSTVRQPNPLTNSLDVLTMTPYIVPGSILGIAFVSAFSRQPMKLTGTALIIIIVLAVKRMPYTVRSSTAILHNIPESLEEASLNLGASSMKTFARITMPLMKSGIISGAIMSILSIITELSSSIMLYTGRTQTMTIAIYAQIIRGNYGLASALSLILSVFTIVLVFLVFKITGNKELSY